MSICLDNEHVRDARHNVICILVWSRSLRLRNPDVSFVSSRAPEKYYLAVNVTEGAHKSTEWSCLTTSAASVPIIVRKKNNIMVLKTQRRPSFKMSDPLYQIHYILLPAQGWQKARHVFPYVRPAMMITVTIKSYWFCLLAFDGLPCCWWPQARLIEYCELCLNF